MCMYVYIYIRISIVISIISSWRASTKQGPHGETPAPEVGVDTLNKLSFQRISSVLCVSSKFVHLTSPTPLISL